ncbi:hypothetical protein FH972_024357 [Carpinus fangiana]|uniref:Uncharacterized protein n=1 Tax=Carpinus fangiana TaxID=176857 RepID=A0A5N6KXT7_9ROSI|nr:hypothetical protein FH972_024357 [Carpinus fangiana]
MWGGLQVGFRNISANSRAEGQVQSLNPKIKDYARKVAWVLKSVRHRREVADNHEAHPQPGITEEDK